ncbi:RING finger protein 37 [Euwallacea fornicatus]|uniref:RING finger protein 37 n=1 Tax=Euwallacea fornicatus TaxID=995702 RepID=UPI00338E7F3C
MGVKTYKNPKLLPQLTNKPSPTENYDASNLISTIYSERIKGFIGYPSIKPPIEVEFQLLCNVSIYYIYINSCVGNQKCSGIEIFAKGNSNHYESIGKCLFDKPSVIFCNGRKYSSMNHPPGFNAQNVDLCFFKSYTFRSFLNASSVKIVIFRTDKSVPCLGKIEIWGMPAKTCSQKTVDTVLHLNKRPVTSNSLPSEDSAVFRIPDEFKDDLTYELMTIPYTLPSGKTIDQSTLEKHVESEKSFGRKPGDPFTGFKFTETLKPVLNVALKSRIDMFLLKNSNQPQTFCLKRSLRNNEPSDKRIMPIESATNSGSKESATIDQDIDNIIKRAKTESGFICFSSLNSEYACTLCKAKLESIYELPCKDGYCRECVLKVSESGVCMKCNIVFAKSEVRKIYT